MLTYFTTITINISLCLLAIEYRRDISKNDAPRVLRRRANAISFPGDPNPGWFDFIMVAISMTVDRRLVRLRASISSEDTPPLSLASISRTSFSVVSILIDARRL